MLGDEKYFYIKKKKELSNRLESTDFPSHALHAFAIFKSQKTLRSFEMDENGLKGILSKRSNNTFAEGVRNRIVLVIRNKIA